jgi:transposase-like protein
MPLSTSLYDIVLAHTCPHCGNKNEKLGSYFWRMRLYHCSQCQQPVTLNYDDKLKLFAEHATLAKLGPR